MFGLVSIIMPSYNTGKYIKESIDSVLNQTYKNWELIIVDDCSTDNSIEIIKSFNDPRIRLFINETNSGAALSRNKALREAKGDWIAFLDSDDLWLPTKLEEQLKFMVTNNYDFTFTDYQIKISNGDSYICFGPNTVDFKKNLKSCYFSTITVLYKKEKIGLIQIAKQNTTDDYAIWFNALKKATSHRYPAILSIYNKHDQSLSGVSFWKKIKDLKIFFKANYNNYFFAYTYCAVRFSLVTFINKMTKKYKRKDNNA